MPDFSVILIILLLCTIVWQLVLVLQHLEESATERERHERDREAWRPDANRWPPRKS